MSSLQTRVLFFDCSRNTIGMAFTINCNPFSPHKNLFLQVMEILRQKHLQGGFSVYFMVFLECRCVSPGSVSLESFLVEELNTLGNILLRKE